MIDHSTIINIACGLFAGIPIGIIFMGLLAVNPVDAQSETAEQLGILQARCDRRKIEVDYWCDSYQSLLSITERRTNALLCIRVLARKLDLIGIDNACATALEGDEAEENHA